MHPFKLSILVEFKSGMFKDNTTLKHLIKGQGYLLVSKGKIKIGDIEASLGDLISKNEEEISPVCHPDTECHLD